MFNWYYSYINVLVDDMQPSNKIAPFWSTKKNGIDKKTFF